MDYQAFLNTSFGAIGALALFIINGQSSRLKTLEDRISEIPMNYVSKADYTQQLAEIKQTLHRIEEKLDRKVDK
jgi:hypothetical protein